MTDTIADDRLEGAVEIAGFWLGSTDKHAVRKTRYLLDRGVLPHGREGSLIVASKRALRAAFDRMTSGAKQAA